MEKQVTDFIESGIIELSVMGYATEQQNALLKKLVADHPEVQKALDNFTENIEKYILSKSIEPSANTKPMIMANIDYQERIRNGEPIILPKLLSPSSLIKDYSDWLNRADMQPANDYDNIQAKIIGASTKATIGIVWIKNKTTPETHTHELESFLIVEGTCIITIGEQRHLLSAGDYLAIPLFVPHQVVVTSTIPCKAILQRIAA